MIGANSLPTKIPLLASRPLMTTLDTTIDLANMTVRFETICTTTTLHMVNGHIAVSIAEFNKHPKLVSAWKDSCDRLASDARAGLITDEVHVVERQASSQTLDRNPPSEHASPVAALMAATMEAHGLTDPHVGTSSPTLPSRSQPGPDREGHHYGDIKHFGGHGATYNDADHIGGHTYELDMPPSVHGQARQPTRSLREVPAVRHQMEVERPAERVGTLRRTIAFLTAATAFVSQCLGQLVAEPQSTASPTNHGQTASPWT